MPISCWITKATNTHSEYVTFITFPRQQRMHERASVLGYTCSTSPVLFTSRTGDGKYNYESCDFLSFFRRVVEDSDVLGYAAASMARTYVSLKTRTVSYLETSGSSYPFKQRHIPEERNSLASSKSTITTKLFSGRYKPLPLELICMSPIGFLVRAMCSVSRGYRRRNTR